MTDIVLAEAKRGEARLNRPWTSPNAGGLDYVVRRVGVVREDKIGPLASELYSRGRATGSAFVVRMVCFGRSRGALDQTATFIGWEHVLAFIRGRFAQNEGLKAEHDNWDEFGKYLWRELVGGTSVTADEILDGWLRRPQGIPAG